MEFDDIIKVGRTQLMDAVPMRLGSEFRAFAVTVGEDIDRLREFANLLREVNLGGTAIGTGINTPEGYSATGHSPSLENLGHAAGHGRRSDRSHLRHGRLRHLLRRAETHRREALEDLQ